MARKGPDLPIKSLDQIKREKAEREQNSHDKDDTVEKSNEGPEEATPSASKQGMGSKQASKPYQRRDSREGKRKPSEPPGEVKSLEQIRKEKEKRHEGEEHEEEDAKLEKKQTQVSANGETLTVGYSVYIPEHAKKQLEERRKQLEEEHKRRMAEYQSQMASEDASNP